jgi:hypothetical protein
MSGPFPPIEPYGSGMLDGGDGSWVYWECCGEPRRQAGALSAWRPRVVAGWPESDDPKRG